MELEYEILKDPVHGYVKLYDHEKKIVDTPIFQRLRRIKQLSVADYVYPGAVHTRFSHCLGVMHVAGVFTETLLQKIPDISQTEREKYFYLMRLWGLSHDLGHGPFSHLFDDEILVSRNKDHETLGAKIVKEDPSIAGIKFPCDISAEQLSSIMTSQEDWPLKEPLGKTGVSEQIFKYVCTGAFSADIIDYLLRDSLFTGAGYGDVDWQRLVFLSHPVGNRVLLEPKAEDAFDSFLLARLFMFSTVYYHRTVRAFAKIAGWFLRDLDTVGFFKEYIDDSKAYSRLDESILVPKMAEGTSKFGLALLERKSPYSTIDEMPLNITEPDQAQYLDGEIMTKAVRDAMGTSAANLPEESFFVDTPKIELNPMLYEQKIGFRGRESNEEPRDRDIRLTRWGVLSPAVGVARLYIHDDQASLVKTIRDAFRNPIKKKPHVHM
jgi:HD superfamily phosphohydrolase